MEKLDELLQELSRELSVLVALIAVAGSLATSEIFGWQTFTLSTLQRLMMYPLVPIIGAGIAFEKKDLRRFVLPLSTIGAFISSYHYTIVRFDPTQGCGFALPCTTAYRYTIGSLSIRPMYLPLLALIGFIIISFLTFRYEPK